MNGAVAVRATVQQRHAGTVVVSGMTLQAQHGLAHLEHVPMHRPVRGVALQAAFCHGGVLVGERPLKFRVALETELIEVVSAQIVGRGPAMRVMAVRAAHLGFANRVMIGEIAFCGLFAVTADAGLISLTAGVQLRFLDVHAVAVDAPDVMHLVRTGRPVLQRGRAGMTTQADSVCRFGGLRAELDDLGVTVFALEVQAGRTVTLFARHGFLKMDCPPVGLVLLRMAAQALLRADPFCALDLQVLRKILLSGRMITRRLVVLLGKKTRRTNCAKPGQEEADA